MRMATSQVEALDKEAEKLRALNLKMKETQSALAAAEKRAAAAEADEQRQSAELAAHVRSLEACQVCVCVCVCLYICICMYKCKYRQTCWRVRRCGTAWRQSMRSW